MTDLSKFYYEPSPEMTQAKSVLTLELMSTDVELSLKVKELIEVMKKKAKDEASIDNGPNPRTNNRNNDDGPSLTEQLDYMEILILKTYKEMVTYDPGDFDSLIDTMSQVASSLGVTNAPDDFEGSLETKDGDGDFGKFAAARRDMGDWEGKLAQDFLGNYLDPFADDIIYAQGNLARFLQHNAQLMKNMYEHRRKTCRNIADDTITALEAINDSKGSDIAFMLMGFMAGFGGLFGGMATTATNQLRIATASFATNSSAAIGGKASGEEKEVPLGADTVDGVIKNMFDALDEINKTTEKDEETVLRSLQQVEKLAYPLVTSDADKKGNELVPYHPDVIMADAQSVEDGLTVYE